MTISSTIRKAGPFPGNGSTVALPFTFKVFTAADVLAVKAVTATGVETTLTLGTDYAVSLNTDQNTLPGGTLTLAAAHATGTTVTLTSQVANTQGTDLTNLGGFYPKVINDALDRTTIQIQQLAEKVGRSLLSAVSASTPAKLPAPAATKVLAWNAAGTDLENVDMIAGQSALADALASGGGSALVGFTPAGTGAVPTTVQKELRGNVFAGAFGAVFDGVTSDSVNINKVILDLALRSPTGGVIKFPAGQLCKITSPLLIPSNIKLDLNGCALVGQGPTTGVMFETAYLSGGALVTNVGTAYQSHVIKNAKIYNGYVYNVGKMCNFQNFNMGCKVQDIELFNARQFGVFDACFYAKFDTVMHSGGTDVSLPSFHFKSANNNIRLDKVVTTAEWDYLFEGGSTAVSFDECSTEGGTIGIKVKGDMLGLSIKGHYAEALMTFLDLSEAGTVKLHSSSNYFNYVDVVLDDGGSTTAGPQIGGVWDESNFIANIGGVLGPATYRGRMQISAQQNLARYQLPSNSGFGVVTAPANWITSANSNLEFVSTVSGATISDYRQKSKVTPGALIAPYRVGDTGPVYSGAVPFSTVTIGATTTIDTKIAWQPNSLFAKFSFTAQDGNGLHTLYGDIYGANFKRHDADPMVMAISNNGGFVRISLTQTAPTFLQVTGSVQICG